MWITYVVLALMLSSPAAARPRATPQNRDAPRATGEIAARLAAYERSVDAGSAAAAELEALARAVITHVANATQPEAVVLACSSSIWMAEGCPAKLWTVARARTVDIDARVRAAAALVTAKEPAAADFLVTMVKPLAPSRLPPVARFITVLKPEQSVPLLEPMLQAHDQAAETAACRALGTIDSAESRHAIAAYLSSPSAIPGMPATYACVLASAALGDPGNERMAGFIANSLNGESLIAAAEILMRSDRERAISHLQQVTRESVGLPRYEAAERLASIRPDVAKPIVEQGIRETDGHLRAAALEVHRALKLPASREVRALMVDPNPVVDLRAAEAVLAGIPR
jgi:hypothetical protein